MVVEVLYVGSDFSSLRQCASDALKFKICQTGQQAREELHKGAFEVVVLSADLSDVSFQELIAHIKEVDDGACIILQVEPGDMSNVEKALVLGADHYLIKGRGHAGLLLHLKKTTRRMNKPVYSQNLNKEHVSIQRAKEELRESQESYRQLVEVSPNAIVACIDGRMFLANNRAARLFGVTSPEALMGKEICEYIHPKDQHYLRARVEHVLTKKVTMPFVEGRVVNHRQEVLDVEIAAAPFTHHGKAAVQFVIHDITEHRQMQEALQESNQKLHAVINASPLAIHCLDHNGKVTHWNAAAELLTGWEAEEVMGNVMPAVWDEYSEPLWDAQKCLIKEQPVFGLETRIKRKDGSWVDVAVFLAPLCDKNSQMNGILAIMQDITMRKKMEDEFLKASKMETIGILAGGIAHDYNNILTVMAGNISLAQIYLGSNADKVGEKIKEIERALLQARELTRQLATFSKGGAPAKKVLPLKRLIRSAVSLSLKGSNVKGEFSFQENLQMVEIDKGQIKQALNNIIINAAQAMPQGGRIWVGAENVSCGDSCQNEVCCLKDGVYVKITIRDEGSGIPKGDLVKIFDPFFTTKPQGSGLGLPTAFSIVKRHGGTITVDSRVGEGTSFAIYLPASNEKKARTETKAMGLVPGRGKILIMDDEEPIRKVVSEMLQYLGYEARTAADGAEALQTYQKAMDAGFPFDAVIMDLTVPGGMGGKETIEKLKRLDPQVKAIVSSGYSEDPVMSNYQEYGFRGISLKPYKAEELSRALEKVLKGR